MYVGTVWRKIQLNTLSLCAEGNLRREMAAGHHKSENKVPKMIEAPELWDTVGRMGFSILHQKMGDELRIIFAPFTTETIFIYDADCEVNCFSQQKLNCD